MRRKKMILVVASNTFDEIASTTVDGKFLVSVLFYLFSSSQFLKC
jgi:hypothetical protein